MIVYLPADAHTLYVCPAGDMTVGDEIPAEWVDADNNPLTFEIAFRGGCAEVADSVGRYLLAKKLANKTRLVL